jgi:predicted RNA-binding Zn ribbon-like protein
MKTPKSQVIPFQLVAGDPALDFVNTLDWRFRASGAEELLNDYADLVRFCVQTGLLTSTEARKLVSGPSARKTRVLAGTKRLRECLASMLYTILKAQRPRSEDVSAISTFARKARHREALAWSDFRFQWENEASDADILETPYSRLLSAALDLLTSGRMAHVRACSNADCRWLFLDRSKNKGRRWCDMKLCGNRIKARRYRGRQRNAAADGR